MGAIFSEVSGANRRAANAAEDAALARERQAQRGLETARETQASLLAALEDPQTLERMESSLSAQERQIGRQERLIESIDPAIREAATQALALLQGKEAASLGPAKQQRERQRQRLVNTLREQLGPGAETSSAGIQALTQFDQETNQLLAQQQQSTLGGLLGIAAQAKPDVGVTAARLGQSAQGITGQRLQGRATGGQFVQSAFAPTINTAGSQFVGEGLRAQQQQQIGSDIFRAGLAVATGGQSELFSGLGNLFGGGNAGNTTTGVSPAGDTFTGRVNTAPQNFMFG